MNNDKVVLIADDDADDRFFLKRAFQKAGVLCRILTVADGQQAVDYLSGVPPYDDREQHPAPDLVILDLKMPMLDGWNVLEWLQGRPEWRQLPTIVLSSSGEAPEVARSRQLGARDYWVKPNDFDDLVGIARSLDTAWLSQQAAPPDAPPVSQHLETRWRRC